jgi:hypothetical protein
MPDGPDETAPQNDYDGVGDQPEYKKEDIVFDHEDIRLVNQESKNTPSMKLRDPDGNFVKAKPVAYSGSMEGVALGAFYFLVPETQVEEAQKHLNALMATGAMFMGKAV